MTVQGRGRVPLFAILSALVALAGCSQSMGDGLVSSMTAPSVGLFGSSAKERECLARAMYFESNRSSRAGMVAVGSVVMNRKESDLYPDSVCGVVGQKGQFASGVLTKTMDEKGEKKALAVADAVLKGERHPRVGKDAMFFHQAGRKYSYKNMHYVAQAGGNAFYEKRSSRRPQQTAPLPGVEITATAAVASVEPAKPRRVTKLRRSRRATPAGATAPAPSQTPVAANVPVLMPVEPAMPSAERFGGAPAVTEPAEPVTAFQ